MGALAGAIESGPQKKKGPSCGVGMWLATLDDETREEARTLLADPLWPHTELAKTFEPLGLDVAAATLARHRRGDCKNCG